MNGGKIWVGFLTIIFVGLLSHPIGAEEKKPPAPPIHIQSNTLEALEEKKLVIFSGQAVAVRGDMVLKGDRILVYYKSTEGRKEEGGEVDRIEVQGNVVVTQKERTAYGDQAVYEQSTQQIVMTGNAVLKEGKNVVRGDKITWIIPEKRGVVEGGGKTRVTATIYPSEREEKKGEEAGGKKVK
ncbi:MAG TPA: lipopolysaccharide transport periplasmic protein LptA [Syntrophales bacterium]|nr:lipopolysaccharide transport periplasmic protein LptA [Syntrophales bacterium]HOL59818.1 lipopolysaccharide transport periplasmic protein LptA [Syntrophales bacterium]HPO35964.1 lipopolysaccharide transport periplasmic protein LptA [Syntrophales bacterium]